MPGRGRPRHQSLRPDRHRRAHGREDEFAFSRRGIGGGAFAGYDWAPADWLRLGVEAGGTIGGRAPFARFGNGDYARDPRFDLRIVGRAWVVGGGVEYRVSDRIGLRLEGRDQPRAGGQILLGVPIRF